MATIWRVRDRLGRDVALTEAGWAHIAARHGNVMAGREWDVREAIRRADVIHRDSVRSDRDCHYVRLEWRRALLKVVVEYRDDPAPHAPTGVVITAYPTENVKPKEERRWP